MAYERPLITSRILVVDERDQFLREKPRECFATARLAACVGGVPRLHLRGRKIPEPVSVWDGNNDHLWARAITIHAAQLMHESHDGLEMRVPVHEVEHGIAC